MPKIGEIYKDIPGYEGLYKISNQGYVESYDMIMPHPHSKTGYAKKRGRKLKTMYHDGVPTIIIYKDQKPYGYSLNRLVYSLFIGEIPDYLFVHPIDGNAKNSKWNNLFLHHHTRLPHA